MKVDSSLPENYARVVVDTNVLLSAALLPRSGPARLVDRLLSDSRLIFSPATFAELESRIWKPKFDRFLTMELRKQILKDFDASAYWVSVKPALEEQVFSRDRSDDAFIHAAFAADASRLITGDEDLLILHPIGSLQIITVRQALEEIGMT